MEVGSDYLFTRQTICFNFGLTARYSHPFPINRSGLALCCGLSVWWWKTGRRATTNCISADLRYSCLWLNRWTHLLIHRQTCEFCTARWSLWLHCVATLGLSAVRVRVPFCLVHTRYSSMHFSFQSHKKDCSVLFLSYNTGLSVHFFPPVLISVKPFTLVLRRLPSIAFSLVKMLLPGLSHTVDHITPILPSLHWLPVHFCADYKFYCWPSRPYKSRPLITPKEPADPLWAWAASWIT